MGICLAVEIKHEQSSSRISDFPFKEDHGVNFAFLMLNEHQTIPYGFF